MLTKRTHIVSILLAAFAAAALAVPAAALGANGDSDAIGVSKAKPLSVARIAPPVAHFHHAIRVVRRQIRAERRAELRRERREAFAQLPGGVDLATLEAIASCESGGDPTIVSSDGSYRGKYQFSYETWASVGGSGDPAAAPEAEQDYRAALLYASAGSSPWPVCG